eukprot:Clim_evm2s175 gene=Clim_evmTU2s175
MVITSHKTATAALKAKVDAHRQARTIASNGSGDSQTHVNMVVAVRVRPENDKEKESHRNIIRTVDKKIVVFDAKGDTVEEEDDDLPKAIKNRFTSAKAPKDIRYAFDRVFDEESTQQEVFEGTTKPLIDNVLNGYNATVFAYGATGAGKTHTMLGYNDDPGVMVQTMKALFERIEDEKENWVVDVKLTYLEVYNETLRDLLNPGKPLNLREAGKECVVAGISLHSPTDADDVLRLLHYGNKNRTQHPTDANAQSSRSHAVAQIYLERRARTGDVKASVTSAKLSLIDLAGSERGTATTNKGARMLEGANINKSLLALGNCINALVRASQRGKPAHIPYRDSKLTRLLKDSLGGNTRTVMIANISPSSQTYEDTHNTLKYANRAKNIKLQNKQNTHTVKFHISKYTTIIEDLHKEVEGLKRQLIEKDAEIHALKAAAQAAQQTEKPQQRKSTAMDVDETSTKVESASLSAPESSPAVKTKGQDFLAEANNFLADIDIIFDDLKERYDESARLNQNLFAIEADMRQQKRQRDRLVEILRTNKSMSKNIKSSVDEQFLGCEERIENFTKDRAELQAAKERVDDIIKSSQSEFESILTSAKNAGEPIYGLVKRDLERRQSKLKLEETMRDVKASEDGRTKLESEAHSNERIVTILLDVIGKQKQAIRDLGGEKNSSISKQYRKAMRAVTQEFTSDRVTWWDGPMAVSTPPEGQQEMKDKRISLDSQLSLEEMNIDDEENTMNLIHSLGPKSQLKRPVSPYFESAKQSSPGKLIGLNDNGESEASSEGSTSDLVDSMNNPPPKRQKSGERRPSSARAGAITSTKHLKPHGYRSKSDGHRTSTNKTPLKELAGNGNYGSTPRHRSLSERSVPGFMKQTLSASSKRRAGGSGSPGSKENTLHNSSVTPSRRVVTPGVKQRNGAITGVRRSIGV